MEKGEESKVDITFLAYLGARSRAASLLEDRAPARWQADDVLEFLLAAITGKAPMRRQQARVVPPSAPPPSSGRARRPTIQRDQKRFPWE